MSERDVAGRTQPKPSLPVGSSTFERPVEEAAAALAEKEHSTAEDRRRYVEIVSRSAEQAATRLLERYGISATEP